MFAGSQGATIAGGFWNDIARNSDYSAIGGGVIVRGVTVNVIYEDDAAWNVTAATSLGLVQDAYLQVQGNGENIRWAPRCGRRS